MTHSSPNLWLSTDEDIVTSEWMTTTGDLHFRIRIEF
jgi:hypothetical protein